MWLYNLAKSKVYWVQTPGLPDLFIMHRKPRMQLEEIINLKPALLSAAAEPLTSSLKGGLSHYHLAPSLTKTV